ncbi:MAG: tetratricopeptide repeat protein [Nitrospirota bacterium]
MRILFLIITVCSFSILAIATKGFSGHAPVMKDIGSVKQKMPAPNGSEQKEDPPTPPELKNPGDDPKKWEEDLFTMIPTEHKKAFQPVLDIYQRGEVERAIAETKILAKNPTLSETATFLISDFYFRRWETVGGEGEELKDSLNAFEMALRQYSGVENADRLLLKRGNLYLHLNKYIEASGSFNRVVVNSSQKKMYGASAQVGLMKSYRGLRRPDEVSRAYPYLADYNPSLTNQQIGAFLYADALFELGRFNDAHLRFQATKILLPGTDARMIKDPELFFHYGEAAYRTGHLKEAKEILQKLYKKYPDHFVSPIALSMLSNILRKEGDKEGAQVLADKIYLMASFHPTARIAKIVAATGRLTTMDCQNPCKSETIKQSIRHIDAEAKSLMLDRPFSTTAQIAILDGLIEMRRHVSFEMAEDLYEQMIPILPSLSPYLHHVQSYLHQTVLEHFDQIEDPQEVIALFHRFRKAFNVAKMREAVGFKIAKSHMELGLLADAIEYFKPISANTGSPHAQESFYYMGVLLAQMGRYPDAQNMLETFLTRYPNRKDVLLPLGDVYNAQKRIPLAIDAYQKWLTHHPKHDERKGVFKTLSDAYRAKKETDREIQIYHQWIAEEGAEAKRPYIRLADAYYQKKLYSKSIEYYQRALKTEKEKKDVDWVKLRLGASYEAIGDKSGAEKIFKLVSKEAKTAVIKNTAREKNATLKRENKALEAAKKGKTLVAKNNPKKNTKAHDLDQKKISKQNSEH